MEKKYYYSSVHKLKDSKNNEKNPNPVQSPKVKKKKKPRKFLFFLPLILLVLVAIVLVGVKVSNLKHHADNIKTDLELMLTHIKEKDVTSAEAALQQSYADCDALEDTLSDSFWQTLAKIPPIQHEIESGQELIEVLKTAQDKLLTPLLALMKEKPLTALRVGDNGFNVGLIISYLDFVESVNPELLSLTEQLKGISTDSLTGSMVGKYKDKIQSYMETYSKASAYLPVLRAIIGNGEDKYFLLTAQNSAEIRASGGFPGSIGTIQITDGLLTIGDFKGVNSVLIDSISEASEVTDKETSLFGTWVYAPRDACFIPAFNRTGQIWAVACEDYQRTNGAQDHERDTDSSSETEQTEETANEWDQGYTGEWYDGYTEGYDVFYNPSTYESRISYYLADDETYASEEVETAEAPVQEAEPLASFASPDAQNETDYASGLNSGDGSVFYSYNNDYYGYGGSTDQYVHYVDGVISLTPAIIQMLMADTGDITLSDGTVLNEYNATKVLQYDLYHKYYDEATIDIYSDWKADRLFAETAKKVMREFVSSFEVSKFADYYEIFKEASAKRILMLWLADEDQEQLLDEVGLSGKLNFNPDAPEVGAYFSLADPSKLGWYLDIETYVNEEPVINYDGTRTYDVEVTLRNIISEEDILASNYYITGAYNGGIRGFIHFFGPAGGHLSDYEPPEDMYILEDTYQNLDVGYNLDVLIQPGESKVFKFKATTAPFVETPLSIIHTPTLTEYR